MTGRRFPGGRLATALRLAEAATLASSLGIAGCSLAGGESTTPAARWIVVQEPARSPGTPRSAGALPEEGSRVVRVEALGRTHVLSEGFSRAGDAALSPDAMRILFAGRTDSDVAFRIYEVPIDGGTPRARTPAGLEAVDPAWIAGGGIAFRGRRVDEAGRPAADAGLGEADAWSLWTTTPEREEPRRITFGTTNVHGLAALRDGRLVFVARGGASERPRLLVVNVDGTGVGYFAEPTAEATDLRRPRETADGRIVAVAAGADGRTWIEEFPLRRPRARVAASSGTYGSAATAFGGEGLLVTRRPTNVGPEERPTLALYRWIGSPPELEGPLFDDPDREDVQAIAVETRDEPRGRLSLVQPGETWGEVLCLDVHETAGVALAERVASVLVSETVRVPGNGGARVAARPLGVVDVAEDGSFLARVPPDVPLSLALRARDGTVLAQTEGTFWLRPGERRGCIGCHEDPLLLPENRKPLAVLSDPVDLTASAAVAGRAP